MTTKVKGLIKGLRYISQIFDEEKEAEIQIGFPTDVKHVAHIGGDGPSAGDNPSWMKEFKGTGALKSAPLGPPTDSKDNQEIKWVSEDPKGRAKARRQSDNDAAAGDSPKSSKPRPRRTKNADGTKSKDSGAGESSGADAPKKSRRKKSRDFNNDGSCHRSSRRSSAASGAAGATSSSDKAINNDHSESSISSKPLIKDDDGENF